MHAISVIRVIMVIRPAVRHLAFPYSSIFLPPLHRNAIGNITPPTERFPPIRLGGAPAPSPPLETEWSCIVGKVISWIILLVLCCYEEDPRNLLLPSLAWAVVGRSCCYLCDPTRPVQNDLGVATIPLNRGGGGCFSTHMCWFLS